MMMRQAKLVTFVISLMTDITNSAVKPCTSEWCAGWARDEIPEIWNMMTGSACVLFRQPL
jgi:hypothetical protein